MQLKIVRQGQNIEAHIELSLSERRVAQQIAPANLFRGKGLAELEMGVTVPASEEDALRAVCVGLKRSIDAHPSAGQVEVVDIEAEPQKEPWWEYFRRVDVQITMLWIALVLSTLLHGIDHA